MASTGQFESEQNFSKAERRFLLFQVALNDPKLNSVVSPRGSNASISPQEAVRISDPVDYDNPGSSIYWRNLSKFRDSNGNNSYTEKLKQEFEAFLKDFQDAITFGKIDLKRSGEKQTPYTEISTFIKSSEGYSTRLDGLDSRLTLVMARPSSTDMVAGDKAAPGQILVSMSDDVFGQLNPQENDIVVVKVAYNPTENFEPEYIGMVTKVEKSFVHGQIDAFTLEVFGLSKILYTTQMVSSKSLNSKEFIPGIEMNDAEKPSPFSNNFNNKDSREIVRFVLENSLSSKEIDQKTAQFLYRLDPDVFISFSKFGFQHNIFVLLALFLMSTTDAPESEERLFPQNEPITNQSVVDGFNTDVSDAVKKSGVEIGANSIIAKRPVLDFFVRGVVERGNQLSYNRMVKQGFEKFFSQMAKPADILGEVRSNTYSDVFESRDGIIVCRPPRFNKVESTASELIRTSAEQHPEVLLQLSPEKVWEFNPNSDFVIKSEDTMSIGSIAKDEMALESRIDVKVMFPYAGEVDYPTALYIDPDILFRYGLRTHGPVTNPNAYKKPLARLFAPIALAMINAPTRTLDVVVKDTRKYFIGKLYYLEAIDMVAFLVQDTINHKNPSGSTRSLVFNMLRQVVRRSIAEIKQSVNEILNVGMMFTTDFPDAANLQSEASKSGIAILDANNGKGGGKLDPKNFMFSKGLSFLNVLEGKTTQAPNQPGAQDLADQASAPGTQSNREAKGSESGQRASGPRLVMFKYIPCIEDLIMEVESSPTLAEPPAKNENNIADAQRQAKDVRIKTFVQDDFLYFTAGQPAFQALNFRFQMFRPAITAINNELVRERPEAFALNDPAAIQYQRSAFAPESVAGILGYLFPSPIQLDSGFVEVTAGKSTPVVDQRTPFRAETLSDPPQNLSLSQVLTNQLASLDLFMKFKPTLDTNLVGGNAVTTLRMDKNRIPQLYYRSGDEFLLFGSRLKPQDYLASLTNNFSVKRGLLPVLSFQDEIFTYPGTLKLNRNMDAFENDFFSIPVRNGAFDLPYGHFMLKQSTGFTTDFPGNVTFIRVQSTNSKLSGGNFKVSKSSMGSWLFEPLNNESEIVDESSGNVLTRNDLPLERSSPAPNELYFISPYLEPTIERLLDIPLPVKYGGNLTSQNADEQKRLSDKGALTSQAFRQSGMAINVSPDYLFVASGGNIFTKPPLYTRFEAMVFRNGIFQPGRAKKVENAVTAQQVFSSGESGTSKNLAFYTLQVVPDDEFVYASKIQVNQGAGPLSI